MGFVQFTGNETMRVLPTFLFAVAMTAALIGETAAKPFTYVNERFGTSATFPDEIFTEQQEPPANDDGLRWLSDDGASISIYGSYNVLDETPKTLEKSGRAHPRRTVAYSRTGSNWVVLSGVDNGLAFYERQLIGRSGIIHSLQITYPKELKTKYDLLVGMIAYSFHGP
jgi:hypothetical protein